MPLAPAYDKLIKSRLADMANVGGRPAGSITAAQFLKRFVKDERALDPPRHRRRRLMPRETELAPKGATGWGVRALDRLIRDRYEGVTAVAEVLFYQLTATPIEATLPELLEKSPRRAAGGWCCAAAPRPGSAGLDDRALDLPRRRLPAARPAPAGGTTRAQPVLPDLRRDNRNDADVLMLVDGARADVDEMAGFDAHLPALRRQRRRAPWRTRAPTGARSTRRGCRRSTGRRTAGAGCRRRSGERCEGRRSHSSGETGVSEGDGEVPVDG